MKMNMYVGDFFLSKPFEEYEKMQLNLVKNLKWLDFSKLEDFCIINTNASVDHECIIKKSAFIGPNTTLCGKVDIGEKSFLGAGVIVKDKISICGNCTIGAGGVVVKDIIQKATYVGVPVKSMGV